jgi:hypothetical protein
MLYGIYHFKHSAFAMDMPRSLVKINVVKEVDMFTKTLLMLSSVLLLTGCILQSALPNFSDADGVLLLGKKDAAYQLYSKESGTWKIEGRALVFSVLGTSYTFEDEKKKAHVMFVPVAKTWWIAQFQEGSKESIYVLVDAQADAIYVHPLACKEIARVLHQSTFIKYKDDDCFLNAGTKAKDLLPLIATAGKRESKWIAKK